AVVVEIAGSKSPPEAVIGGGSIGDAGRFLSPALRAGFCEAVAGPIQDIDGAGIRHSEDAILRRTNSEIITMIAIEITDGEREAEFFIHVNIILEAENVLVENFVAGSGETGGGAIEHVNFAGLGCAIDSLARNPDGEIITAIVVEIACGKSVAKCGIDLEI